MSLGTDDGRVAIVVRPLDHTFNFLRLIVIPALVLVVGLPTLRILFGPIELKLDNWALILLVVLIAGAYLIFMQLATIRDRVDEVFARLRRQVALACDHDEIQRRFRARCHLTPQVFRVPLFQYDEQRTAVRSLAEACNGDKPGGYWFVEGESGSGKTRTAFRLIQTLARDRHLCEFGSRCFVYDFGESERIQKEFLGRLGTARLDRAVVFVDNFHLVRADVLNALTNRLLNRPGDPPEQLLVFLSRPGDAWNLSPRSDVRLLAEAKADARYLELDGASAGTVTRFVSAFDRKASELLRGLGHDQVATAAQLHLAQVIARHRRAPAEAIAMMHLLQGDADPEEFPGLTYVLAAASALSIHRGTFSRREFRRTIRAAGRDRGGMSGLRFAIQVRWIARRLQRIGLIPKLQLGGTRFLFHEAIAELCVDRMYRYASYDQPFAAISARRLKEQQNKGEDLTAWLIAAEIGDFATLGQDFDAALGYGAYQRMARCLKRVQDRLSFPPEVRLQLAILLDRTGAFKASRAEFTDDLLTALEPSEELAIILAASRIEASHDQASEVGIDALRRSSDRLAVLIGEYWKLHIAAHRGQFDSSGMLALGNEALSLIEGRQSQHWLTYALGRMHFDSLRHHYLKGGLPTEEIASSERRTLDLYLAERLPTYEAQHVLYRRAHLVGHVLLPRLAIFAQPLDASDRALAQIGASDAVTVDNLSAEALRLYRRAREEFWQYGDREAEYLQADVLNVEMMQTKVALDSFVVRINEYQAFIEETEFEALYSYPHFYFLRWSVLKHYQEIFDESEGRDSADYLKRASAHLRQMTELDLAAGNRYGLSRARVLELLLQATRTNVEPDAWTTLAQQMKENGYGFEERLARHLAAMPNITHAELREIFRFFPFVQQ